MELAVGKRSTVLSYLASSTENGFLVLLATTCQNKEKVGKFFEALKKLGN